MITGIRSLYVSLPATCFALRIPYGAISGLLHSDRADLEPRGGERSCIRYAKSERYPIERVDSCPHNYGAGSRVLIEAGTFVYENGV